MILVTSCVEEIPLETESFESIIVVEATITDENKHQEVLLSRSFKFNGSPILESNATVQVSDDVSNTYTFTETEPGIYRSEISFSAQDNRNYTLSIITSEGEKYRSSDVQLTQQTSIDDLYAKRNFNENGVEGISINVDSYDATGNSKYYRHEYEETYKIIAPLYSTEELISNGVEFPILEADKPNWDTIQDLIDFLVTRRSRPIQEQICYNTVKSNTIIQVNTTNFIEDRLDEYRVKFLSRNDPSIRERYSILVRQFVQSREAFVFYETLNSFSDSENIFYEDQPGFLEGNLFLENDKTENVFGFFEVTSVAEKRIFFNYDDLFPSEALPSYFAECDDFYTPELLVEDEDVTHTWIRSPLVDAINNGFQFYEENSEEIFSPFGPGPFVLVLEPCGDCTFLGNNIIPDFWEE
jgi:hypothetical protein